MSKEWDGVERRQFLGRPEHDSIEALGDLPEEFDVSSSEESPKEQRFSKREIEEMALAVAVDGPVMAELNGTENAADTIKLWPAVVREVAERMVSAIESRCGFALSEESKDNIMRGIAPRLAKILTTNEFL